MSWDIDEVKKQKNKITESFIRDHPEISKAEGDFGTDMVVVVMVAGFIHKLFGIDLADAPGLASEFFRAYGIDPSRSIKILEKFKQDREKALREGRI